MSRVEIEIPDDRWFHGDWKIRPKEKQFFVAILKNPFKFEIRVCRYKNGFAMDCNRRSALHWSIVYWWKPINIPSDIDVERQEIISDFSI